MSALELAAAGLALVNVGLLVWRSVWNYPFGIAAVILYAVVFWQARLYSDALLQVFFLVIQAYGWWAWAKSPAEGGQVKVRHLDAEGRAAALLVAALLSGGLGFVMARTTDAAAPYADAAIAGFSVVAQWLLARRMVESWALWIGVDVLAVWLFLDRGLVPTAILYAVFLVLAAWGGIAWLRALRPGGQVPP